MAGELSWMKQEFKKHDLNVKAVKGWKQRGRPYTFSPIGVVFHHTASNSNGGAIPALGTVTNGRPGIPGPLCNILIGRDLSVNLVAAGYANHAGEGGPYRSVPANSGNRYFIGIEVENNGIGEPWKDALLDVVARVSAICLEHTQHGAEWCIGHKTWTTRKIDPANIDMAKFQAKVRKHLKG
jgi:N-acetylmuramoyl-L-alanine amidase CwlA